MHWMDSYNYSAGDIETGGLKATRHSLIEVGFILDNLQVLVEPGDLDDYIRKLPKFHCYVLQEEYIGQPIALAMNATALRRIGKKEEGYLYLPTEEVMPAVHHFFSSHGLEMPILMAGKNFAGFDKLFLEELPQVEGKEVKFHHRFLDPAMKYMSRQDLKPPSLQECLDRAGIDHVVSHTALDDAAQIIKLLKIHSWKEFMHKA